MKKGIDNRVLWVVLVVVILVFLVFAYQSVMFSPFSRVVKSGGPLESGVKSGLGSDLADNQVPDDGGGHGGFGEERPPFERREKPSEGDDCESDDDCSRCENCQERVCVLKEEMCADFKIETLTYVDPESGEETWEEIPLPNEDNPVEKGLKIRFDASVSSGDIEWFFWNFGDGTYQNGEVVEKQCNRNLNVELTLYNADWTEWDQITKTVRVEETSVELIGETPYPGFVFKTKYHTVNDGEVWAISNYGDIGYLDVSNMPELPPIQRTYEDLTEYYDIDFANGKLYVARGTLGVSVFNANPDDFYLIRTISPEELGAYYVMSVVAKENYLYVTTANNNDGEIKVFDFTDVNNPVFVESLVLEHGVMYMARLGQEAIEAHGWGSEGFSIVDIREPGNPEVSLTHWWPEGVTVCSPAAVNGHLFALTSSGGSRKSEIFVPENIDEPIILGPVQLMPQGAVCAAITRSNFYGRITDEINKYNTVNPFEPPYYQETFDLVSPVAIPSFVYDPDDDGPEPEYLFFGESFGYKAFVD